MVTEAEDSKIEVVAPKKAKPSRTAKPVPTPEESAAASLAEHPAPEVLPESDQLTFQSLDINDRTPDQSLLRQTFQHTKNEKRFMVVGFAWNAITDEWNMIMMERNVGNPVPIVRPVTDLTSKFEDGAARFRSSPDAL